MCRRSSSIARRNDVLTIGSRLGPGTRPGIRPGIRPRIRHERTQPNQDGRIHRSYAPPSGVAMTRWWLGMRRLRVRLAFFLVGGILVTAVTFYALLLTVTRGWLD